MSVLIAKVEDFLKILLLFSTVFSAVEASATESEQNPNIIGELIPSIPTGIEHTNGGMVLSADGQKIYVFDKGKVSCFQIYPFKKLEDESFQIATKLNSDIWFQNHLFIGGDGNRLIVKSENELLLIDLNSKRLLKKVSLPKGVRIEWAILYDDKLLAFSSRFTVFDSITRKKLPVGQEYVQSPFYNQTTKKHQNMVIWDATSLDVLESKRIDFLVSRWGAIHKFGDTAILISAPSSLSLGEFKILDLKTLQLSESLLAVSALRPNIQTFYDNKHLYFHDITHEKSSSPLRTFISFEYNLETKLFSEPGADKSGRYYKNEKGLFLPRNSSRVLNTFSQAGKYFLSGLYVGYKLTERISQKEEYFAYFEDGEAILHNRDTNEFKLTTNARKHLKMTMDGKTFEPISDEVFNKYNTTER